MNAPKTLRELSCADDYDPNSMPVDKARALIRQFLAPLTTVERVHIRQALDRVLAEDITSPIDVPGHDNSAMDGWAVRFADLSADRATTLKRVGESFAGKPSGREVRAGEAVRIFTGGVMPAGADTVVMQERATELPEGVSIAPGAVDVCRRLLSIEERVRAELFMFERHRRQYIFAHALLRLALSQAAPNVAPTDWSFAIGRYGRPFVAAPATSTALHFSLSHADGCVACVVSRHEAIGVDVETVSRRVAASLLAHAARLAAAVISSSLAV